MAPKQLNLTDFYTSFIMLDSQPRDGNTAMDVGLTCCASSRIRCAAASRFSTQSCAFPSLWRIVRVTRVPRVPEMLTGVRKKLEVGLERPFRNRTAPTQLVEDICCRLDLSSLAGTIHSQKGSRQEHQDRTLSGSLRLLGGGDVVRGFRSISQGHIDRILQQSSAAPETSFWQTATLADRLFRFLFRLCTFLDVDHKIKVTLGSLPLVGTGLMSHRRSPFVTYVKFWSLSSSGIHRNLMDTHWWSAHATT